MAFATTLKNTTILATLIVSGVVSAAEAQQNSNFYSRDKYEAVRDRYQPEFDPEPLRLGVFLVDSAVEVGLTATDNVFAVTGNQNLTANPELELSEESDLIAQAGVDVRARTDWSNHELEASARVFRNQYIDFSEESSTNIDLGLGGRFDISRQFQIGARATFRDAVEQRQSFSSAVGIDRPVDFQRFGGQVYANFQNDRIRWTNSVGFLDSDYDDGTIIPAPAFGDDIFDQDFRDRRDFNATSRVSYAITPNVAVFGQGQYLQSDYDNEQFVNPDGFLVDDSQVTFDGATPVLTGGDPANPTLLEAVTRDNKGYTAQVGVDFEPTSLVRGEIAVGYFESNQDNDFFSDVDGVSVDGRVFWFPSRLTTVEFNGGRRAQDNGVIESPSTLRTNVGARIDHELFRNIIVSGFGNYVKDDFEGITREDDTFDVGAAVTYKMNKRIHLEGYYVHANRDAAGIDAGSFDPSFASNTVGIALKFHP